jgi:hypothetical protein
LREEAPDGELKYKCSTKRSLNSTVTNKDWDGIPGEESLNQSCEKLRAAMARLNSSAAVRRLGDVTSHVTN